MKTVRVLILISMLVLTWMHAGKAWVAEPAAIVEDLPEELAPELEPLPPFDPSDALITDPRKKMPIVRLTMPESESRPDHTFCSGTVISHKYILTAAHCVDGLSPREPVLEIRSLNGESTGISAALAGIYSRGDLALLVGDFSDFNAAPMVYSTRPILDLVYSEMPKLACGYPHGGQLYCASLEHPRPFFFQVKMDGDQLYPAMSGGPVIVLMAEQAVVVGVVTAGFEDGSSLLSPAVEVFAVTGVPVAGPKQ